MRTHIIYPFSADTFQFPLLYSHLCFSFRFIFSAFLTGIWIFITSRGRIQDEIYDVLLTNPSREVAWGRIVYLRMHTRSIGRRKIKYISQRRDEFGNSSISLYYNK